MKSNISNHPCSGKCTSFNGEQCSHCLIPSRSTELNHTDLHEFAIGDVVVRTDIDRNYLYEVLFVDSYSLQLQIMDQPKLGSIWLAPYEARSASTAELKEGRRLPDPVALFIAEAV